MRCLITVVHVSEAASLAMGLVDMCQFSRTIKGVHEGITRDGRASSTSGCSKSASACRASPVSPGYPGAFYLTCCQRMMYADLVPAHEMFNGLISGKVDGVGRSCADYDAGHASPQAQDALAGGHSICSLDHAIVDGGRGGVENLHPSLYRIAR